MSESQTAATVTDLSKLLSAMKTMTDLDPNAIQLYTVKAERIQGEPNCMVKLPCKYEGEDLVVLVGIAAAATN
jgi:hypothetical protein